jgi:hypothetical protein
MAQTIGALVVEMVANTAKCGSLEGWHVGSPGSIGTT